MVLTEVPHQSRVETLFYAEANAENRYLVRPAPSPFWLSRILSQNVSGLPVFDWCPCQVRPALQAATGSSTRRQQPLQRHVAYLSPYFLIEHASATGRLPDLYEGIQVRPTIP